MNDQFSHYESVGDRLMDIKDHEAAEKAYRKAMSYLHCSDRYLNDFNRLQAKIIKSLEEQL